ncbi:MAG TPA: hypothetical protein DF613_07350 [Lachnospiraceae bacterium]|nr:hypothetical protein [Lachnospiraceae bacterium]
MDNEKGLLSEILKRVQKNYRHMVEIERLTKELGEAFSRNDHDSAQLLLKMRGNEMDEATQTKYEIHTLVQDVDNEERKNVEAWLKGEAAGSSQEFEAVKIRELSGQMLQAVRRTIALDKAISSRMAGEDSYYHSPV